MREPTVYLNGQFIPASQAKVSLFDGAFLHGVGLFETMRAQNSRVFRLDAHLKRLAASAEYLPAPLTPRDLPGQDVFTSLLELNDLKDARLRLTVTPGSTLHQPAQPPPLTIAITMDRLTGYPETLYQTGLTARIEPHFLIPFHDPIARHKTTCYLPRLVALRTARRARCGETLFFDDRRRLAEGACSNVFLVTAGRVRTPSLEGPILPGIARAAVIELAKERRIEVDDHTPITIDDLLDADEVFLTNSILQVMPVCRVERHDVKDGRPGPTTRTLLQAYRDRVALECGPAQEFPINSVF